MTLLISLLLLVQIDGCPKDDYVAKYMSCADSALCDRVSTKEARDLDLVEAWGEPCHLYALMPTGWDNQTPARGLFLVGKLFPSYALSWDGPDGKPYGALQAFEEGRLSHTVLAIATESTLWGCGERHQSRLDPEALEAAGVCIDSTGAPVANPWWQLPRTKSSVATHSLLKRCDGTVASVFSGLESHANGLDEEEWQASGVLASQVLERLRNVSGFELVCITDALAEARRKALATSSGS